MICRKCGQSAEVTPRSKYCGDGSDKDNEHRYDLSAMPEEAREAGETISQWKDRVSEIITIRPDGGLAAEAERDQEIRDRIVERQEATGKPGRLNAVEQLKSQATDEEIAEGVAAHHDRLNRPGGFMAEAAEARAAQLAEAKLRGEDAEATRWQEAIDKLIAERIPSDVQIDGSGTDSGDPLDLTLDELRQAFDYFVSGNVVEATVRDRELQEAIEEATQIGEQSEASRWQVALRRVLSSRGVPKRIMDETIAAIEREVDAGIGEEGDPETIEGEEDRLDRVIEDLSTAHETMDRQARTIEELVAHANRLAEIQLRVLEALKEARRPPGPTILGVAPALNSEQLADFHFSLERATMPTISGGSQLLDEIRRLKRDALERGGPGALKLPEASLPIPYLLGRLRLLDPATDVSQVIEGLRADGDSDLVVTALLDGLRATTPEDWYDRILKF